MKTVKLLILAGLLSSCSMLSRPRPVSLDRASIEALKDKPTTNRFDRYFNCIKELNREGLKQSLIGELCDKTFGSIND